MMAGSVLKFGLKVEVEYMCGDVEERLNVR